LTYTHAAKLKDIACRKVKQCWMVKTSVKVSRNPEITTKVREVSLQPFTRKKKSFKEKKK